MRLRPPVFVTDNHNVDIAVFYSVQEAEGFIEPVDVQAGEIEVFDSEGRRLDVQVERNRTIINLRDELEQRDELSARITDLPTALRCF